MLGFPLDKVAVLEEVHAQNDECNESVAENKH